MRESAYQADLIKRLRKLLPGCEILKNDTKYKQGIPDLSIFYNDRWAMLEVKASANSSEQPNQEYYVEKFSAMSFAAFIHPENEAEVLHDLQLALSSSR
jgi:hypothetical protein